MSRTLPWNLAIYLRALASLSEGEPSLEPWFPGLGPDESDVSLSAGKFAPFEEEIARFLVEMDRPRPILSGRLRSLRAVLEAPEDCQAAFRERLVAKTAEAQIDNGATVIAVEIDLNGVPLEKIRWAVRDVQSAWMAAESVLGDRRDKVAFSCKVELEGAELGRPSIEWLADWYTITSALDWAV